MGGIRSNRYFFVNAASPGFTGDGPIIPADRRFLIKEISITKRGAGAGTITVMNRTSGTGVDILYATLGAQPTQLTFARDTIMLPGDRLAVEILVTGNVGLYITGFDLFLP